MLSALVFNVFPTFLEVSMVSGVLVSNKTIVSKNTSLLLTFHLGL